MKNQRNVYYLILGLVFFVGAGLGYLAWDHITLPFSNPMEIVGPPVLHSVNPYNDVLRFFDFIFLPSGLLTLFYFFIFFRVETKIYHLSPPRKYVSGEAGGKISFFYFRIFLVVFAALLSLNIPTYHAFGRFDPFHEGESMGPAMSLMDHQVPYRDFFFFHGIFQDPMRSALAFQCFGKSIGAQRSLESLLKVGTWMLLALFLARVFWKRSYAFAVLILTAVFSVPFLFDIGVEPFIRPHEPENIVNVFMRWESPFSFFHRIILSDRDFWVMAFLLAFLAFLENARADFPLKKRFEFWFSTFSLAFVPWLALADSVDRGVYLIAAAFILSAWFILCFFKKKGFLPVYVSGSVMGGLCGFVVLGMVSHWNYSGFFNFVFDVLPRYKLLTDALPYPIHDLQFILVLFLLSFYCFRMTQAFLRLIFFEKLKTTEALRVFLFQDGVRTVLLIFSLFCFRNVLERPVFDHLAYNFICIFLLVIWDVFLIFRNFFEGKFFRRLSYGMGILGLIFIGLSAYRLIEFDQWEKNFPLKMSDDSFLSEDRRQVVSFMRVELKVGEPFFAFTNDASWYYLLDRVCPTAYPCLWVASPKVFQQQVVDSLERKKIRIILYKNSFWASDIDDIPDTERFPIITQYIQDHYVPYKKIADQEIWIRKS